MKIYIAFCQDRHIDADIHIFTTPDAAIEYAKKFVVDHARHSDDINENEIEGWLYYCTFSAEGDYVYVIEGELDK